MNRTAITLIPGEVTEESLADYLMDRLAEVRAFDEGEDGTMLRVAVSVERMGELSHNEEQEGE